MIDYETEKIIVEPITFASGYDIKYKQKNGRILYDRVTFTANSDPVDGHFLGHKCYSSHICWPEYHKDVVIVGHSFAETMEKLHNYVLNYAKEIRGTRNIPLIDIREGQEMLVDENMLVELALGLK